MPTTTEIDKAYLPDFLIIGAGKSGTTSVDNYLKQHPSIYVSKVKEPNFFGYELMNEIDFDDKDELKHYQSSVTDIDSYINLFKEAEQGQIKGETSNTYLYHKDAPERIKHYVPDAKLIAIFRQPAERLYSRYLHLARENELPTQNFEDCLDKSTIWWERNDLVKEGFYYKNLSKFYDYFPKENIKVYLFDELRNDAHGVLKDIFQFVGVDASYELDLSIEYNKSGFIKNKFYDKLIGQNSVIKKGIKSLIPRRSFEKLKENPWMRKKFNSITEKNLHRPKLDPALKAKITNDIYKDDIQRLAALTGKDLSHWLA